LGSQGSGNGAACGTKALAADDLLVCIAFSLLFFLFLELAKIWRLWRRQITADT